MALKNIVNIHEGEDLIDFCIVSLLQLHVCGTTDSSDEMRCHGFDHVDKAFFSLCYCSLAALLRKTSTLFHNAEEKIAETLFIFVEKNILFGRGDNFF